MRPSEWLQTRRRAALIGVICAATGWAGFAVAQETRNEETKRRAELLRTLPDFAAKRHFGQVAAPAPLAARAIGSYAKGCLAGATALPVDGQSWQVMRLSRNRNWGHPTLIALVERLSRAAPKEVGWPGLLVGDISQPRGGPMLTGHASHQVGLDADVWLTPMPARRLTAEERESVPATNMVRQDRLDVDPDAWTANHTRLIRLAAREPAVARIFVNAAIKKALCREATGDRSWLTKVRPMFGHNYHFHIRIACPAGSEDCADQDPPAAGDGCGPELDHWFSDAVLNPKPPKVTRPPPPPMSLDALPPVCRQVLVAK